MVGHSTYDNLIQFWERIGKSMSHASALATATVYLWPRRKKKPTHLNNNGINFDINTNITKAQEIH